MRIGEVENDERRDFGEEKEKSREVERNGDFSPFFSYFRTRVDNYQDIFSKFYFYKKVVS